MDIDDHTLIISDWLDPILLRRCNNVITYNNGIYNGKFTMSKNIIEIRMILRIQVMFHFTYKNESTKCYVDILIDALPTLDEYLQIYVFKKWSMWSPNLYNKQGH